jgi:hypothetical protein
MNVAKIAKKIVKQCRIDNPKHFKLDVHDPAERFGLSTDIAAVRPILAEGIASQSCSRGFIRTVSGRRPGSLRLHVLFRYKDAGPTCS